MACRERDARLTLKELRPYWWNEPDVRLQLCQEGRLPRLGGGEVKTATVFLYMRGNGTLDEWAVRGVKAHWEEVRQPGSYNGTFNEKAGETPVTVSRGVETSTNAKKEEYKTDTVKQAFEREHPGATWLKPKKTQTIKAMLYLKQAASEAVEVKYKNSVNTATTEGKVASTAGTAQWTELTLTGAVKEELELESGFGELNVVLKTVKASKVEVFCIVVPVIVEYEEGGTEGTAVQKVAFTQAVAGNKVAAGTRTATVAFQGQTAGLKSTTGTATQKAAAQQTTPGRKETSGTTTQRTGLRQTVAGVKNALAAAAQSLAARQATPTGTKTGTGTAAQTLAARQPTPTGFKTATQAVAQKGAFQAATVAFKSTTGTAGGLLGWLQAIATGTGEPETLNCFAKEVKKNEGAAKLWEVEGGGSTLEAINKTAVDPAEPSSIKKLFSRSTEGKGGLLTAVFTIPSLAGKRVTGATLHVFALADGEEVLEVGFKSLALGSHTGAVGWHKVSISTAEIEAHLTTQAAWEELEGFIEHRTTIGREPKVTEMYLSLEVEPAGGESFAGSIKQTIAVAQQILGFKTTQSPAVQTTAAKQTAPGFKGAFAATAQKTAVRQATAGTKTAASANSQTFPVRQTTVAFKSAAGSTTQRTALGQAITSAGEAFAGTVLQAFAFTQKLAGTKTATSTVTQRAALRQPAPKGTKTAAGTAVQKVALAATSAGVKRAAATVLQRLGFTQTALRFTPTHYGYLTFKHRTDGNLTATSHVAGTVTARNRTAGSLTATSRTDGTISATHRTDGNLTSRRP